MIPFDYAARFRAEGSTQDALISVVVGMINEVIELAQTGKLHSNADVFLAWDRMNAGFETFVGRVGGRLVDGSSINKHGFKVALKLQKPESFNAWNESRGGKLLA